MKRKKLLAFVTLSLLWGCQSRTPAPDIDGFGDYQFGDSFDTIAVPNLSRFNPLMVADCLKNIAFKGCLLGSSESAPTYKAIDGVPFSLGMQFNKRAALIGISLEFERSQIGDKLVKLTKSECVDVNNRAVDWLSKSYGSLNAKNPGDKTVFITAKTESGNRFLVAKNTDREFFAFGRKNFGSGRKITLLTAFIDTNGSLSCSVQVTFSDSDHSLGRAAL